MTLGFARLTCSLSKIKFCCRNSSHIIWKMVYIQKLFSFLRHKVYLRRYGRPTCAIFFLLPLQFFWLLAYPFCIGHFAKKEKNGMKWQKVIFQKSQKLLTETPTKGRLFRTFNIYSFNFNGGLCNYRIGSCLCRAPWPGDEQFLWFLKSDLLRFHPIFSFLTQPNICFLRCAKLCPNMIHFDALDFSECCSEEVISFFWCSMYLKANTDTTQGGITLHFQFTFMFYCIRYVASHSFALSP